MKFLNTFIYSNHPLVRITRHVLFWTTDIINYLFVASVNAEITMVDIYRVIFVIPLVIGATYFIMYYLIPQFSKEGNKTKLILGLIASILFVGMATRFFRYYVVIPMVDPDAVLPDNLWDVRRIIGEIFSWLAVMAMAVVIKLLKSRMELQSHNTRLQQEKKLAELSFLKAQMQPHFLFNTLNTLYSETIQDSGKAQQVVLHLSNLLRFILEECNHATIPLQKEIKVVRDFIQLEQLRHGSRLRVNLQVEEMDTTVHVSPLIFLPFVENSFKHTLANIRGPIQIDIQIGKHVDRLFLNVENDLVEKVNVNDVSGRGISNIRNQLDLIYGSGYELSTDSADKKYKVKLSIPTSISPHD